MSIAERFGAVYARVEERLGDALRSMEAGGASRNEVKRFIAAEVRKELAKEKEAEGGERPAKRRRGEAGMSEVKQAKKVTKELQTAAASQGFKILIDLSFVKDAPLAARRSLLKQIAEVYRHNRVAAQPAKIILCGGTRDFQKEFTSFHPGEVDTPLLQWVESDVESVVGIQKDNLVYLSADAHEDLCFIEHDAAYVIGGILDRNSQKGKTQSKAEGLGLRSVRLPLDAYLSRRQRPVTTKKVLTVNQVAQILLDSKSFCNNWDFALDRNMPFRRTQPEKLALKTEYAQHPQLVKTIIQGEMTSSWAFPRFSKPPVALVSGASSGLGLAFSKCLRARGWSVVMVSRDAVRLNRAAEQVSAITIAGERKGPTPFVMAIPADCTSRWELTRMTLAISSKDLSIDLVVASSGTFMWDDDERFQLDPLYLFKQNLHSRISLFRELRRVFYRGKAVYRTTTPSEEESHPEAYLEFSFCSSADSGTAHTSPYLREQSPAADLPAGDVPAADVSAADVSAADVPAAEKRVNLGDVQEEIAAQSSQDESKYPLTFVCIGSAAGAPDFKLVFPDAENEEKYISSMQAVRAWCLKLSEFSRSAIPDMKIVLLEPPLVDTPLARREFSKLPSINWSALPSAQAYVESALEDILRQ